MTPHADHFASAVATDLRALEHDLDRTLAQAGQLITTLASGRISAGLGAAVGHDGAAQLGEALVSIMTARGQIVGAHRAFERGARAVGMNWTTAGGYETKPTDPIKDRPTGVAA